MDVTLLCMFLTTICAHAIQDDRFVNYDGMSPSPEHHRTTKVSPNLSNVNLQESFYQKNDEPKSECCLYGNNVQWGDLYNILTLPSVQYHNFCNNKFLQVFKPPRTMDMLIFGSIYNNNSGTMRFDFRMLQQLYFFGDEKHMYEYRTVFRFDPNYGFPNVSHNIYKVVLNKVVYEIKLEKTIYEYMLPEKLFFNVSDNNIPEMTISDNTNEYIDTSYAIVCLEPSHSTANCTLVLEGTRVSCYCVQSNKGLSPILLNQVALWTLLIVLLVYFNWWGGEGSISDITEAQFNLVLCPPGKSTYHYLAIFRIGPATKGFDYQSSYIDILLLSEGDHPIGATLRYECRNLSDRKNIELHMIIGRISRQPPITAVTISHSDHRNLIYFNNFTLVDLNDENNWWVLQEEPIDEFITSDETTFRLLSNRASSSNTKADLHKLPLSSKLEMLLEDLPSSFTILDKIAICALVIGLVALLLVVARVYLHCFVYYKDDSKWIWQSVGCLLVIGAIVWLVILAVRTVYLCFIKQPYEKQSYRMRDNSQNCQSFLGVIRMTFLVLLYLIGIGLSTSAICYSSSLDHISASMWSGVYICSLSWTVAVWLLVDDFVFAYQRSVRANQDYSNLTMTTNGPTISLVTRETKKFSELSKLSLTQSRLVSNFGPKLINPNWNNSNKDASLNPNYIESYLRFKQTRHLRSRTMPIVDQQLAVQPLKDKSKSLSKKSLSVNQKNGPNKSKSQFRKIINSQKGSSLHKSDVREKPSLSITSKMISTSKECKTYNTSSIWSSGQASSKRLLKVSSPSIKINAKSLKSTVEKSKKPTNSQQK